MALNSFVFWFALAACVFRTQSQWKIFLQHRAQVGVVLLKIEDIIVQYGDGKKIPPYTMRSSTGVDLQEPNSKKWTSYTFGASLDQNRKTQKFVLQLRKGKVPLCIAPEELAKKLNDGSAQIRIPKGKLEGQPKGKDFYVTKDRDGKKMKKPPAPAGGTAFKTVNCKAAQNKHIDLHQERYNKKNPHSPVEHAREQYWDEYMDEDMEQDREEEQASEHALLSIASVLIAIAGCCLLAVCCAAVGVFFGFVAGYIVLFQDNKQNSEPESIEVSVAD